MKNQKAQLRFFKQIWTKSSRS